MDMADLFDGTTPSHTEAAQKRAAAATATPDVRGGYVAALLAERHGYVTRGGMGDRVAAVDAELARVGYVDPDAKPARVESKPETRKK
jgi:hypothetical protein